MSTKVGSIHYELDLDDKEYNKKADKASSSFDSLGSKIAGVGTGIAKATGTALLAVGTAVAGVVTASVKAYGEYEQMVGGVQKIFGESADTVIANSRRAYETAGMNANAYMETVTGFSARLLQSLGGDTVKASEVADLAIRDMSDNANTFGTDIEMIKSAYQGFAKANFTMLDNLKLGYGGTAGEMARLINETGVMGDAFEATAENVKNIGFDKMIEAVHIAQEGLKITGTTAKEASETIQGSMNTAKASWQNLLTSLGTGDTDVIKDAMDGLATSVGNAFRNISEIIPTILEGLVSVVAEIGNMDFSGLITGIIAQIPRIIELAVSLVGSLVQGIRDNLPLLVESAISIIQTLVGGLIELLPEILMLGIDLLITLGQGIAEAIPELIPTIVDVVLTMVETLIDNLPLIIQVALQIIIALVEGLINALPRLIDFIPNIIISIVSAIIQLLPQILIAGVHLLLELGKGLISAIPRLLVMIPQIIVAIIGGIAHGFTEMVNSGANLVSGLWQGIKNSGTWIKNQITGWVGDVMKFIKRLFGISSPSKLFEQEIGLNLGAGIAEGIEGSIGMVEDAMGVMGDAVEASISPVIEPALGALEMPSVMQGVPVSDLYGASSQTINQDIDINIDKINDNQDLNALATQLGFRASLLGI